MINRFPAVSGIRGFKMSYHQLLSIGTNAKTKKGDQFGFMTGVLYLAPSDISGINTCPMAEIAGCEKACLYSAGRGAFSNVQNARIAKTNRFFADREGFMADLVKSIAFLIRKAEKAHLIPLVRLNGTSDIRFENVFFTVIEKGLKHMTNIFEMFPDVVFYDYTKISNRKGIPANYDLTFSYSGTLAYQPFVAQAIKAGLRIAAVFRKRSDIPASFMGLPVVDGDNSDIRHIEPKGVIVALYAKGQAKKDQSGFVIDSLKRTISLKAA